MTLPTNALARPGTCPLQKADDDTHDVAMNPINQLQSQVAALRASESTAQRDYKWWLEAYLP